MQVSATLSRCLYSHNGVQDGHTAMGGRGAVTRLQWCCAGACPASAASVQLRDFRDDAEGGIVEIADVSAFKRLVGAKVICHQGG